MKKHVVKHMINYVFFHMLNHVFNHVNIFSRKAHVLMSEGPYGETAVCCAIQFNIREAHLDIIRRYSLYMYNQDGCVPD